MQVVVDDNCGSADGSFYIHAVQMRLFPKIVSDFRTENNELSIMHAKENYGNISC